MASLADRLRRGPRASRFGGAVAQLGERLVRNEEVSGSIPLGSTILTYDADRLGYIAAVISNPMSFAILEVPPWRDML
jgi:hypothetical protein